MMLSIVVIGRDEAEHLGAALDHALSGARAMQAMGHTTEVLFVDCGSRDTSPMIAGARPPVRVLSLTEAPLNAARARNVGIAAARGKFIQLLDGDMFLAPRWLTQAWAALVVEGLDAVGGQIEERRLRATPWNRAFGLDWAKAPSRGAILGGAALWRTGSLRALGGFDTSLNVGEDPDLYLRAQAAGLGVARLPEVMASHDLGLTSPLAWWRRAWSVGRSRAAVFLKHPEGPSVRRNLHRPVLTLGALALGLSCAAVAGPMALYAMALVASGLIARHAIRAHARGTPWGDAAIHASHVYAVHVPVALSALAFLFTPFRHGATR